MHKIEVIRWTENRPRICVQKPEFKIVGRMRRRHDVINGRVS